MPPISASRFCPSPNAIVASLGPGPPATSSPPVARRRPACQPHPAPSLRDEHTVALPTPRPGESDRPLSHASPKKHGEPPHGVADRLYERLRRNAVHPEDSQQWHASARPDGPRPIRPTSNPRPRRRPAFLHPPATTPYTQRMASSGPHRPNPDGAHQIRPRSQPPPSPPTDLLHPHAATLYAQRMASSGPHRPEPDGAHQITPRPPFLSRPPQRRAPRQQPPTAATGPESAANRNRHPAHAAPAPHHPPSLRALRALR